MSKSKTLDLSNQIMDTIQKRKLKMKPKWYFYLGSILGFLGLFASVVVSAFFISLISFILRPHPGPGYPYRIQLIWSSFPWWAVILAILGLGVSIILLKKYDFSYQKNFWLIIVGLIAATILAGIIMDQSGLTDLWTKKGPMKGMYHQNSYYPPQRNSLN
ncbi:hypothetical protein COX08_00645 [Candidatus Beckwithbacteria bacterium CG23_combo_of_CG06-09_8_20_14_all_34_8]|uniref:Uncharacterized protein n=1 Tax=Candidatus Beckwithbacteria bacterium CG23_combo_of_CG06-09_8_20_14_all_34_8 TaxID=1974497 RepID=A0A2H0B764_9BACT|nr:MAG: hypothetical protein COX08_00645 [Candidatus Beckwithbacteria bacterium CG23_combo_of_CG06-09_8_20_14_all_34_8]